VRGGVPLAGLNRKPATTVRQLDVNIVTAVDKCDSSGKNCKKEVKAEVTIGTGSSGKVRGSATYFATGTYDPERNSVELTPVDDGAWQTTKPDNVWAGKLVGQLTQEGEFVVGTYQSTDKCVCRVGDSGAKGATCRRWDNAKKPWCYVTPDCAEKFQTVDDAGAKPAAKYRAYCDEGTCAAPVQEAACAVFRPLLVLPLLSACTGAHTTTFRAHAHAYTHARAPRACVPLPARPAATA